VQLNFARWPFALPEARLPEENERWWSECYLPHSVEDILESRSQWCILTGGYQSGKSTALAVLQRNWQERALLIQDDFLPQPPQEKTQGNILSHILSQASWVLRHHLGETPDDFSLLSTTQKEFLRWSLEKFHGRRAFLRWLDGLREDVAQTMQNIEFEDIYPSQTNDVDGQVEELTNLSKRLGYQQVLVTVDTPPFPTSEQVQEIRQTLGWLNPMQHIGLKLVMALPPSFTPREIMELSRGRASVLEMEASSERPLQIATRHISAATQGTLQNIDQLCSPKLALQLQGFTQEEFGSPTTGAWLKIVEILLDMASEGAKLPLQVDLFAKIRLAFYKRFMPLRLGSDNTELGVWRGYKWVTMDRAVYDFLALLIHHKDRRVGHEIVGTSKSNLHTLASRLRDAIEPDPLQTIYLKNQKGEGYWLENFVS